MKRHVVTFSIEVYGDTPEEVKANAEYIREYTEEWMGETGEAGNGYSTKIVSIDSEPCLPTEEELEEEREAAEMQAHVVRRRVHGEYVRIENKENGTATHARVLADRGDALEVLTREGSGDKLVIERRVIRDITTWRPVCGHGVNHFVSDCPDCSEGVKRFLHGLMRNPTR